MFPRTKGHLTKNAKGLRPTRRLFGNMGERLISVGTCHKVNMFVEGGRPNSLEFVLEIMEWDWASFSSDAKSIQDVGYTSKSVPRMLRAVEASCLRSFRGFKYGLDQAWLHVSNPSFHTDFNCTYLLHTNYCSFRGLWRTGRPGWWESWDWWNWSQQEG